MKKIGLALGSGGTRGLAIIGVLKVFDKYGINIDYIAGSSIGSIIGGVYAIDKDIKKLEEFVLGLSYKGILKSLFIVNPNGGLPKGKKPFSEIEDYVGGRKIENLKLPFAAITTDKESGEAVIIKQGSLTDAMRASSSIPLVLPPFKLANLELIDGGFSQQVPVETVKNMGADVVIAVNLSEKTLSYNKKSKISLIHHYMLLLFKNLAAENCRHADVVVSPNFSSIDWIDNIKNRMTLISEGERAAEEKIHQILNLIR
jgi:NTE family protein